MGSRAAVVHPTIGTESRLKGKRAHIPAPVRAVEQITAQTVIGLLEVLLDDGGCAVRVRAAGVRAVPPAEHALRSGQERGALLDGRAGADDALLHRLEATDTAVSILLILPRVRLILL